jgi:glycosyltransferase involved in cell wall biosynthesis
MKAGMIARWIRKTSAIPYVITEHSAHYGMGSDDDFFSKSPFYKRNVSRIFKEAAVVTNVSAALAEVIRKLFGLTRMCVIHNTVDTDLFNYKLRDKTRFRFIHVSTLTEAQKNIKGILRAVENLAASRDDFEVIIVGPASGELRELVAGPPLKRFVTLTGEISYAEVAGQMQRASALVLFSRYENFPCVVIEALCCGLPVIASDVGGVKEAVAENNGILVQSGNENGLVQAMNRMINDYQNFDRSQIAKDACEKFSYSTIGKQLDELYRKALKLNSAN